MLCCPEVRRILRISAIRKSMLYPTPRLPNLPKPERSRRIWVALTLVYSPISCDEIESRPIFLACVSTCRYRDSRAATPTVSRSCDNDSSLGMVVCDIHEQCSERLRYACPLVTRAV